MRDHGKLLLVGSIARPEDGWDVEDVLRNSAQTVGPYVSMLPDGEIGDRTLWINFIARRVFPGHPDLITTSRHTYDDWKPRTGYGDLWRVTVRDGVESIAIDRIGYADEALQSYATFKRLKDEGVIPNGVRFMVALPLTESATRGFVGTATRSRRRSRRSSPRSRLTSWRSSGIWHVRRQRSRVSSSSSPILIYVGCRQIRWIDIATRSASSRRRFPRRSGSVSTSAMARSSTARGSHRTAATMFRSEILAWPSRC